MERFVFSNRIPKEYIITKGFGDTDLGAGSNPWEIGSFAQARINAQIETFNIMKCSSILPPESVEIPLDKARELYHPGAVMEAIIAQENGLKGEKICAGIGTIRIRKISDQKNIIGFAAEYMGKGDEKEAMDSMHACLMNEYNTRYNTKEYEFYNEKFCIQEHIIEHNFGTVIALIGFVSCIYPLLGKE